MATRTTSAEITYTPAEIGSLVLKEVEQGRANPGMGVRSYLANLDAHMNPLRPGKLVAVIAYTSNYKSGLMNFWARSLARDLAGQGVTDRIGVYVSWEMSIEELGLFQLAAETGLSAQEVAQGKISDEQWGTLKAAAFKRGALPLWGIGHSIDRRRKRPTLTLSDVARALDAMDLGAGIKAEAVFLDYLQNIQAESGDTVRTQVIDNVRRCKDMAIYLGCPVILGVQAKRDVLDRDWKLPELRDAQESAAIEQVADVVLTLWKPSTTEQVGARLPMPKGVNMEIEVTDTLLVVGIKKQRMGAAGKVLYMYVDPDHNMIAPLQVAR